MAEFAAVFSREFFDNIFDMDDEIARESAISEARKKAKGEGMIAPFDATIKQYRADLKAILKSEKQKTSNTIDNYIKLLETEYTDRIKYNELTNSIEIDGRPSSDTTEAEIQAEIENKYNIYSTDKFLSALGIVASRNKYNPFKDIIENIPWDGISRVQEFIPKWMKTDDNAYTREVSQILFDAIIKRVYEPGCKFDEMPVLIGTKQGEGKSQICHYLALEERFFAEINTFEGQPSIEVLQGIVVGEVSELLALNKVKDQNAVKSYLTRRTDKYRKPYQRNVENIPRGCVFVATTNEATFLKDRTGNRRYYPIIVNSSGRELYRHQHEILDYVKQCYAERLVRYENHETNLVLSEKAEKLCEIARGNASEDDPFEELIIDYLSDYPYDTINADALWHGALKQPREKLMSPNDKKRINGIMRYKTEWTEHNGTIHGTKVRGRGWKKPLG